MFNIQGSELIFLLLVALVILGPEKLPDAVRKATKAYSEFKKMANGFQGELRQVLDEPMRELRDTADAVRDAARFDIDLDMGTGQTKSATGSKPNNNPMERATPGVSKIEPRTGPSSARDTGLNFGNASAKRQARVARGEEPAAEPLTEPVAEPAIQPVTDAAPAPATESETEPAPSAEVAEDANE